MKNQRIAVLGCGYWGRNHVRNFKALGALAAVSDPSPAGRELARELAPEVPIYDSPKRIWDDDSIGGVVVATPAVTHVEICREALEAGKDVLCEKPLALTYGEASIVAKLAEARSRILMVGHVLEFHPAILRLRELVAEGQLGELRYIYSNRLNLGKIRQEENILWSFAPHDIAIILRLVGQLPSQVIAAGGTYLQANIADVTITHLLWENGVAAHIFVSWLNPFKEQKLVVVGTRRMATFDDISKELILHDQRVEFQEGAPVPVKGQGTLISFGAEEPLRRQCEAFLEAMATRVPPITDATSALGVLRILQAGQRSLATHGTPVQIPMA